MVIFVAMSFKLMILRRRAGAALGLAAVAVSAGCAVVPDRAPSGAASGAAAPAVDSALAVLTFDSVWSRIANTHYDTAFGGVDWAALGAEYRPRAATARTLPALRGVLLQMLDRLGESHFGLIPHELAGTLDGSGVVASDGEAGLEVRIAEGDIVVWRLDPDGAAAAAGVELGWSLVSVAGRPVAPRLQALAALADQRTARTRLLYQLNAEVSGTAGEELSLRFRRADGREVERRVQLRRRTGEVVSFSSLPPTIAALHAERLQTDAGCVGVIRFTMWLVPLAQAFDRAVDEARDCAGMIVDLRGNPGGVAGMVMGTAGHFLNDTLPLGFMKTRTAELRFKANPRRVRRDGSPTEPFAGRLAILTDEMTASTSEFFAEGLQGVGRARVFGTRSAGQALPAMMVRLPTGDALMYVVANFTGPNGSRIEGRGVVPDDVVEITRQDLLQGRDAPFEAALDWIAGGVTAGQHSGGSEP
jgi:carboxyl-terminal processing protease